MQTIETKEDEMEFAQSNTQPGLALAPCRKSEACSGVRSSGGRASRNRATRLRASALGIMLVFLFAAPSFAAEPRITSSSHSKSSHELTPAERRSASLAASRILRHAFLARIAVAEEDVKKASPEVDQGLKLVEIIESIQPRYTVTAKIQAGDLSYSADEVVIEPLVSIYDEVGEVELFSPIDASKREQQAVREDVVADVAVKHTSVSLNIALAKAGLLKAKRALEDEDLDRADGALIMVQRATIFEVDEVDVPLAKVRENLFLAHTRMQNGDVAGAQEALDVASESLKEYGKIAGGARAKEVKALRKEIDNYSLESASRDKGSSASASVEKKILGWWDRVVQWWEE